MSEVILKTFIAKLDFVVKKTLNPDVKNYEIKIINHKDSKEQIKGIIIIETKSGEIETIPFDTQKTERTNILSFKSRYQNNGMIEDEIDTYLICNESIPFYGKNSKLLIHVVNGKVHEAYVVNKKHQFENGIHDNLFRLNMNNPEILNVINDISPIHHQKRK